MVYHVYFDLEIMWQHNTTLAFVFDIHAFCRPLTPICGNYPGCQMNTNSPCLYSCCETVFVRDTSKPCWRMQTQSTRHFKVYPTFREITFLLFSLTVWCICWNTHLKHTIDRLRCLRGWQKHQQRQSLIVVWAQMCIDTPRIPNSILFALCHTHSHICHAPGFLFVLSLCSVYQYVMQIVWFLGFCCVNNYWLPYRYTTVCLCMSLCVCGHVKYFWVITPEINILFHYTPVNLCKIILLLGMHWFFGQTVVYQLNFGKKQNKTKGIHQWECPMFVCCVASILRWHIYNNLTTGLWHHCHPFVRLCKLQICFKYERWY